MGPAPLGIIQDVQAASEMEGQRMARLGSSPPSGRLAQILPALTTAKFLIQWERTGFQNLTAVPCPSWPIGR